MSFEIKITDIILKSKLRVLLFGFVVFLVFKLQMKSSSILKSKLVNMWFAITIISICKPVFWGILLRC